MFASTCVVGAGRVGKAVFARLSERLPDVRLTGRELACAGAELVLLCVPDRAIAEVARGIAPGPWVAHTSGAARLSALEPHRRRFSLHPLQTFTAGSRRGAARRRLRGRLGARPTSHGRPASRSPTRSGLRPFELPDDERPVYHAAATVASAFLVTLHEAAAELMDTAGAPPEALEPLMRRTMENGFAPTGPFVRGDLDTVDAHLGAIRARRPQLEPLYRSLADATERLCPDEDGARRSTRCGRRCGLGGEPGARSGSCRRWARSTTAIWRSCGPRARNATSSSSASSSTRRSSRKATISTPTRATRSGTGRSPSRSASTSSSPRPSRRCTRRASRPGSRSRRSRAAWRATRVPATSAASPPSA